MNIMTKSNRSLRALFLKNKFIFLIPVLILIAIVACEEEGIVAPESCQTIANANVRYNDFISENVSVTRDLKYGQNITQGGVNQDLLMDIYEPEGDNEVNRPLVILIHGGGFVGGDKDSFSTLATFLARSGYVAASISYRLIDVERTPSTLFQGIMEAVFDAKAAVRFFRKDAQNANTYRIDSNNIFVGGGSAGGFTALHYAYISSDAEIQTLGGNGLLNFVNAHGGLEGDSGNEGFSSAIKGVLNISGAVINTDILNANEPILLSIHAQDDQVVPFLEGESDGSGVTTQGSGLIHPVAQNLGITNTLIAPSNGGHDVFEQCECCAVQLREFVFMNL